MSMREARYAVALFVGLAACCVASAEARAADLAANVGVLEVVGVPGGAHLGVYPYLGLAAVLPMGSTTLIPSLSFEWSPDQSRDGFVAALTADFGINDTLGFDLNVAFIHDQPKLDFGQSIFLVGGGPGVSLFFGPWTVSPYVSAYRDLSGGGWCVSPAVNLARTL
jgi:hypothetical protein